MAKPNEIVERLKGKPHLERGEVAERLGVSVNTVTGMIERGEFFVKDGSPAAWKEPGRVGRWFILEEAVVNYEDLQVERRVVREVAEDGTTIVSVEVE